MLRASESQTGYSRAVPILDGDMRIARMTSPYNGHVAKHLEAVYERGVLRPLEQWSLAEHQHVRLTIDERTGPLSWRSSEPVDEFGEEIAWLAKESAAYAGQWIALAGSRLAAHGPKPAEVSEAAKAAGVEQPLFAYVPTDDLPFGGW